MEDVLDSGMEDVTEIITDLEQKKNAKEFALNLRDLIDANYQKCKVPVKAIFSNGTMTKNPNTAPSLCMVAASEITTSSKLGRNVVICVLLKKLWIPANNPQNKDHAVDSFGDISSIRHPHSAKNLYTVVVRAMATISPQLKPVNRNVPRPARREIIARFRRLRVIALHERLNGIMILKKGVARRSITLVVMLTKIVSIVKEHVRKIALVKLVKILATYLLNLVNVAITSAVGIGTLKISGVCSSTMEAAEEMEIIFKRNKNAQNLVCLENLKPPKPNRLGPKPNRLGLPLKYQVPHRGYQHWKKFVLCSPILVHAMIINYIITMMELKVFVKTLLTGVVEETTTISKLKKYACNIAVLLEVCPAFLNQFRQLHQKNLRAVRPLKHHKPIPNVMINPTLEIVTKPILPSSSIDLLDSADHLTIQAVEATGTDFIAKKIVKDDADHIEDKIYAILKRIRVHAEVILSNTIMTELFADVSSLFMVVVKETAIDSVLSKNVNITALMMKNPNPI